MGENKKVVKRERLFDVHINRAPIAGTVRRIVYIPGAFMNADPVSGQSSSVLFVHVAI